MKDKGNHIGERKSFYYLLQIVYEVTWKLLSENSRGLKLI